jgi:hypothetical protein
MTQHTALFAITGGTKSLEMPSMMEMCGLAYGFGWNKGGSLMVLVLSERSCSEREMSFLYSWGWHCGR